MPRRAKTETSFRIGRVQGYLRGRTWYLCYYEHGQRRRPRVGTDVDAARKLAAQTNAQLETGDLPVLSFDPVSVPELQRRWLDHHEHVLRSSVHTINRYRTATGHLLNYLANHPVKQCAQFTSRHAEQFVVHLRSIEVAPNGHKNSRKRPLLDKGIKYILESCRAMFNYAARRRHLSAYAINPFSEIQIDRIPVERSKQITLLSPDEEKRFVQTCDDWQFPLFLTLMLMGLRPGELCHLLVEDLDLEQGFLHVRNKPELGWQVKTRAERTIPLVPVLMETLKRHLNGRTGGALFVRRGLVTIDGVNHTAMRETFEQAVLARQDRLGRLLTRQEGAAIAKSIWWAIGAVRDDRVRLEFIGVCETCGLIGQTMPKVLRHGFATALQDANVDPLIRCQLMGHAAGQSNERQPGSGLGMTAVYTHSRPETVRAQLKEAMLRRSFVAAAAARLGLADISSVPVGAGSPPVPRPVHAPDRHAEHRHDHALNGKHVDPAGRAVDRPEEDSCDGLARRAAPVHDLTTLRGALPT